MEVTIASEAAGGELVAEGDEERTVLLGRGPRTGGTARALLADIDRRDRPLGGRSEGM